MLRKRFQDAVAESSVATASVSSLERTVRLLRKNQNVGQAGNESIEIQELKAELEAARYTHHDTTFC